MIRTQSMGNNSSNAPRWTGPGGHSFFINYLQRMLHFCYGPHLAARFHHQCQDITHKSRINCCGFCGRFMEKTATQCPYCQPTRWWHKSSSSEGDHAFFQLLAQYVIALDYPHRAAAIEIVNHNMHLWPVGAEYCLGCATLLVDRSERTLVTRCKHVRNIDADVVQRCSKPWCAGSESGTTIVNLCSDTTCRFGQQQQVAHTIFAYVAAEDL